MALTVSDPYNNWDRFPKPSIPVLSVINSYKFISITNVIGSSCGISELNNKVFTEGGRNALYMALNCIGIKPNQSILLPAYHCLSMVAPVVWSGADAQFYKINPDLSINIEDIKKKITSETKAILAVHYFGFARDLSELSELCRKHSIFLIEDCAHAFFRALGFETKQDKGDFAVISLKKFFPVSDGGILLMKNGGWNPPVQTSIGFVKQLKDILNLLEESYRYDRLGKKGIVSLFFENMNRLRNKRKKKPSLPSGGEKSDLDRVKAWFDPGNANNRISTASKLIFTHSNLKLISDQRRKNYGYLLDNLGGLDTVRPLFSKMDEETVPYMFPLVLNNPDSDFKKLKFQKIPIWRWEELCMTDCETSRYFSKHLIQLPCHQSLRKQELDEIIKAVKAL